MMQEELKNKQRDALYLIIGGVLFFIVAMIVFLVLSSLDTGQLKQASLPKIVYALYKTLGTLGTTAIFVVIGIVCFILGINRKKKLNEICIEE